MRFWVSQYALVGVSDRNGMKTSVTFALTVRRRDRLQPGGGSSFAVFQGPTGPHF
jgi:hypothetical protein